MMHCSCNVCLNCFIRGYEIKLNSSDHIWGCLMNCGNPKPDEKEKCNKHLELLTLLVCYLLVFFLFFYVF